MTKNIENRMKELKSKGLNFNEITAELNKDGLRFNDEFVRHKTLDLIGDINKILLFLYIGNAFVYVF